jgi:hypothetical protein
VWNRSFKKYKGPWRQENTIIEVNAGCALVLGINTVYSMLLCSQQSYQRRRELSLFCRCQNYTPER